MCVPFGHFLQDGRSEDAAEGRQTHQHGRLDVVDNLIQSLVLLAVVVVAGKVDLVGSKLVATVRSDETLGVDKVEAAAGLVLGHALVDEKVDNLLGHAHASAAGAQKHGSMVFGGDARALDGVDDAAKDDGPGSLDVVVEAGVHVAVLFEGGEGVLEVFKLDDDATGIRCCCMKRRERERPTLATFP